MTEQTLTPPRLTSKDFDQETLNLFDRFVHGDIDRRGFIDAASKTLGTAAAVAALETLRPRFAEAQVVKPDDARLSTGRVEYDSPQGNGKMGGYLCRPAGARGKLPGVLVVHENRGLNPHIEDCTRRIALEGFLAFAPDALFPLGGYPGAEDKARELFPKLDQAKTREDFVAAANWLRVHAECTGKTGVVGFCFGGSISNFLSTRVPELLAAVPFYGGQAQVADVPKIKAALLIHYAENDQRINAAWPAYEESLKANKVQYEAYIYPGTQHGFNNDTTPRFDKEAAALAWGRTISFFKKKLA